jgi:hypothetical protein
MKKSLPTIHGKVVLNRKPLTVKQVVYIMENDLFHLIVLPEPEDEMESDMCYIKRLYKHGLITGSTLGILFYLDWDII